MQTYIYDIEVFQDDWIVDFRNPESTHHIVIHNDNYHLREFINQPDIIIGGFNNKHYDDWVILTMLLGGSNLDVKKHNDFIINGGNGWEFPFVQFKKRPFKSFDLRDDTSDIGLSLKAIEGNLYLPIVESSVPFDIKRPLTKEELEESIRYCKHDVDATVELFKARKDYIEAKKLIGEMYHIDIKEALSLTNAKLASRILKAKRVERNDERNYIIPDNIRVDLIPKPILDFFMQIHDKSIDDKKLFSSKLDIVLNGCPCTYAWGGVHGAKLNYVAEATKTRLLLNFDVGSLYPNSMLNFGYVSRNCENPEDFREVVRTRLEYKAKKDKARANALKLPINTTYGAMLEKHNDLYDPWAGRSVCISNQLAMTDLVVQLMQSCKTFEMVNFNTDGVMFFIDANEESIALAIIAEWEKRTGFELERDDIKKIIQKDVNNYICIKQDGEIKAKGGYVNKWKGGDFKKNSLVIVHKAVVEYFVNGTPVEDTINSCKNIFDFQTIAKTGGTYSRSVHYVDGKPIEIQKVNRIYSTKHKCYGQIKKQKFVHEKKIRGEIVKYDPPLLQEDTLSDCPTHCIIDNFNKLTINDIDKQYYIDMAKKRINDFVTPKKVTKKKNTMEVNIMPTAKKETTDYKTLNVYQKLSLARQKFLEAPVKKSGVNTYAEYKYFELADIIPPATSIFAELGLVFLISFEDNIAVGRLVNSDNPEEMIHFYSPIEKMDLKGVNAVQTLGGTQTYLRRYLYLLCLDIVEADAFDATQGKPVEGEPAQPKKSNKPATPEQRKETKEKLIDEGGNATDVQIKSIKNGLKKLREKDQEKYEKYVTTIVKKIKAGLKKAEAEDILIEIGEKIEE